MEQFNLSIYITVIPSIICLALSVFIFMEKKKNKVLSQQLMKAKMRLEVTAKKLGTFQEKQGKSSEFHDNLQVAELTTQLQKPRLEAQRKNSVPPPQGKYSSVPSLAEKGLSPEEIASVLAISTHEAVQLVNLAKLAQGNFAATLAN